MRPGTKLASQEDTATATENTTGPSVARRVIRAIPLLLVAVILVVLFVRERTITLRGAVIRKSDDPTHEPVISGAEVTVREGSLVFGTKSDNTGAFALKVRRSVIRRRPATLEIRHSGYQPYVIPDPAGDQLYVVQMTPLPEPVTERPHIRIGNVSVRYTLKTGTSMDVGSGAKVFQVFNKANVPCKRKRPCSPDGKWKAATATAQLDAGPENEFRNGRVSCIAGPCPFTQIDHDGFSRGGRVISVTVRDWSDTTTFLLQAEAVRHVVSEAIRKSYPVIFDRTMNFSLPDSAEGTCIEAEVDGKPIVFPIVPNLSVTWAGCEMQKEPENSTLYRCELKPGYEFR